MSIQKNNLLKIDYDSGKGLRLSWNFKDLEITEKYFRHLFIIYSTEVQFVKKVLQYYHKRLRSGDFIGVIYSNSSRFVRFKGWHQKTLASDFTINNLIGKSDTSRENRSQMISLAQKETDAGYNEPVVVNIIVEQLGDQSWFDIKIQQLRLLNSFSYIVSFFGPFANNDLSMNHGINHFRLNFESYLELINFYLPFLSQAALYHATLTIKCENGQITSASESIWRSVDFDKIQRHYYGPSLSYEEDMLIFVSMESTKSVYDLAIALEFKTLSNLTFNSFKRVHIDIPKSKCYLRTYANSRQECKNFLLESSMQVIQNPYNSQVIIMFNQRINEGCEK